MQIIAKNEIGNVREINQDYVLYKKINDKETIAVLCDGMGGHKAGEVASKLTCDYIVEHFELHAPFTCDEDIKAWMQLTINNANRYLIEQASLNKEYDGMGTTTVVCYVQEDKCYISHVGDSRAYYLSDGKMNQLTRDDTLVNALVDCGSITQDQAMFHPKKNILLQAIGSSDFLKVSFYKQNFESNLLLLCSDGLSNSLYTSQMYDILTEDNEIENVADKLMSSALIHGGHDNISFIILNKGVVKYE